MSLKEQKAAVLEQLHQLGSPVSSPELLVAIDHTVAERTLRRWLTGWVDEGMLRRTGRKRSTRYQWVRSVRPFQFAFMTGLTESQQLALVRQLRDIWTHTSTALEGNTLTLGDTQFVLEEGLTISGKPLKDHQEVTGHARAIDLLYESLHEPLTEKLIFELHKAVQTEIVTDIYKPDGAWKTEPNGTYVITDDGQQLYLDYAAPLEVEALMGILIRDVNSSGQVPLAQAAAVYARIHMGIAHIHPFWDGNGRIARLLANVPLLKSGLPPIVIPVERRRSYVQILARYQLAIWVLSRTTGVWPDTSMLQEFSGFCEECYATTKDLLTRIRQVKATPKSD